LDLTLDPIAVPHSVFENLYSTLCNSVQNARPNRPDFFGGATSTSLTNITKFKPANPGEVTNQAWQQMSYDVPLSRYIVVSGVRVTVGLSVDAKGF
jgi:hypothetical protein